MISQHYFTFPFQIPRVIRLIKNWPLYLSNYLLRRKRPAEYQLRNGFRLIDGRGTLAGTIAVVFVRQEYGPMENYNTIVDIGSNMGSFAIYAALTCPNARIFCFEPEERNFGYLSRNIAVNSLTGRVRPFQRAVAASSGERVLGIGASPLNSLIEGVADKGQQKVTCTTLREVCKEQGIDKIDLLKMNCEGAEYEIFDGLTKEDYDRLPRIRLEYHHLDDNRRNGKALAQLLKDKGYTIERFSQYRGESGFIWATRK